MVQFVLLGLGGTLAFERANALGVGLLLAACYAAAGILLLRARLRDQLLSAMPVSLMLFSLLYLGQLVIGRSGLGPEKALESKYSTVTTLGLIGLYLLVTSGVARRTNLRTVTSGVLLGVVVVGLVTTGQNGLDEGIDNANVRRKNAYYLSTYGYQTDENLFRLGVDSDMVKRHARVLEQYRLSVFSEPRLDVKGLRRLAGPDTFYLDSVNGREAPETAGVRIDPGRESTIVMLGWAVDGMAGRAAGGVVVDLDGRLQIPALYGLERTDVVRDLGSAAYRYSGFRAEFATALLKRGPHRLTVMIVSADKAGYYLGDRSVTVDVL